MIEIIFIAVLAAAFTIVYTTAFRILPDEKWQVFASVPLKKTGDTTWHGVNITYYGIISATGYVIALSVFMIMMTSAGITPKTLLILSICILVMFIPSAKIMAYIVEKKKHTITIGGAVFVMIISAPWIAAGVNSASGYINAGRAEEGVFIAAMITSYAFGEGFGRLACISFGCCYGRPVREMPVLFRKMFSRFNFVYTGRTKKVSYHDHMDGVETVPVQAVTAVLYTASGLAGLFLFLKGHYYFSFFLSLAITQLWRFTSEFLRADFRGGGIISAYQVMSLLTIPYYTGYVMITGISDSPAPVLLTGLKFMWNPGIILLLLVMWIGGLMYTGISSVTASEISIYVNENRI
jgi:hypothetical protein